MIAPSHPDPLIDEVRQRRRDVYARYGNDLHKVAEAIRALQAQHPEKIVDRRRRRHPTAGPDGGGMEERPKN
jgi:hypothetical protein